MKVQASFTDAEGVMLICFQKATSFIWSAAA
jgi:hypothetical protein